MPPGFNVTPFSLMVISIEKEISEMHGDIDHVIRLFFSLKYDLFGTRDLFNISYSRELYLFSKFLHFEEIVRVKMAVCFEMIVSET